MIDFFINFFSNIFNLVMVALFILIGVLIGLLFKPKAKDQVMKIIPRDRRFIDFNITKETAFSVYCEPKKGYPLQKFIKFSPGYTGKVGRFLKRARTRFIGKEGTAYTWRAIKGEKIELKKNPSGTLLLKGAILIGKLSDALRGVWGEEFYDTVPESERVKLEESKVNVTVELGEGYTPEGFPEITEEQIFDEEDQKGAETFWKGKKMSEKGEWTKDIFLLLAGAGLMAIASKLLGWW